LYYFFTDWPKLRGLVHWAFVDGEIAKARNSNKKISLQPLGFTNWMKDMKGVKVNYQTDLTNRKTPCTVHYSASFAASYLFLPFHLMSNFSFLK